MNTSVRYIQNFKQKTDGVFAASKTRTGNGVISYTVSEPYGLWKPQVGVDFGVGKSIDLSTLGALKVAVGLKFDSASLANTISGVTILFSIKDITGKVIDSKGPNGGHFNQYEDPISIWVDKAGNFSLPFYSAKNTITTTASTTNIGVTYVTIDFNNGGYGVVYPSGDLVNKKCPGSYTIGDSIPTPIRGFDSTRVIGFQMVFLQRSQSTDDCYFNYTLTDLKFDLTEFKMGDIGGIVTANNNEELVNDVSFLAYPNPIKSGNLKLSQVAQNVIVYDAMGSEVFSSNATSEITIDGFRKGLYMIKSSKGSARFVVE